MNNEELEKYEYISHLIRNLLLSLIPLIIFGLLLIIWLKIDPAISLSLCTAIFAVIGLIFSTYDNSVRNRIQMEKADERLKKQLESTENNLKMQLNYDTEIKVILDLYHSLNNYQKARNTLKKNPYAHNVINRMLKEVAVDYEEINKKSIEIFESKLHIYILFKKMRNDIHRFYYIPENMKKNINNYIELIENEACRDRGVSKEQCMKYFTDYIDQFINGVPFEKLNKYERYLADYIGEVFCYESIKLDECLNEVYNDIETETKVKMETLL